MPIKLLIAIKLLSILVRKMSSHVIFHNHISNSFIKEDIKGCNMWVDKIIDATQYLDNAIVSRILKSKLRNCIVMCIVAVFHVWRRNTNILNSCFACKARLHYISFFEIDADQYE